MCSGPPPIRSFGVLLHGRASRVTTRGAWATTVMRNNIKPGRSRLYLQPRLLHMCATCFWPSRFMIPSAARLPPTCPGDWGGVHAPVLAMSYSDFIIICEVWKFSICSQTEHPPLPMGHLFFSLTTFPVLRRAWFSLKGQFAAYSSSVSLWHLLESSRNFLFFFLRVCVVSLLKMFAQNPDFYEFWRQRTSQDLLSGKTTMEEVCRFLRLPLPSECPARATESPDVEIIPVDSVHESPGRRYVFV